MIACFEFFCLRGHFLVTQSEGVLLQQVRKVQQPVISTAVRTVVVLLCVRWQGVDTEYPLAGVPTLLLLGDRLLTLYLRRRRREAALLYPESWWHLTMWGSHPSHFKIIPNTKRQPNNSKTDQLPISKVIAGLPRPYNNTSPPWWAAYAEIWEIRGNPGSTN